MRHEDVNFSRLDVMVFNIICTQMTCLQEYVRGPNQALRKKRQDEGFKGKKLPGDSTTTAACYKNPVQSLDHPKLWHKI